MKCPHCLESFFEELKSHYLDQDRNGASWQVYYCVCPSCGHLIIKLGYREKGNLAFKVRLVHPQGISRTPIPEEVPLKFAEDYKEACLILNDSPKASAALSRRCLQLILREKAGTKSKDLFDQIQEVLDSQLLPSYLSDNLDAVRVVGNFGAHSTKSKNTGEIIAVEPEEAEWNLDIIEGLFDFYFVQASKMLERKSKINIKLEEAGKPLLK